MHRAFCWLLAAFLALAAPSAFSANLGAADLAPLVRGLGAGSYAETEKAIAGLAETGDPAVVPVIEALQAGDLHVRKADGAVVVAKRAGNGYALTDPLTGAALGEADRNAVEKIRINNALRRTISATLGALTLMSPDANTRRQAAEAVFKSRDANALDALNTALGKETDERVRRAMTQARASVLLAGDAPDADKIAAVAVLQERGDQDARALLNGAANTGSDAVKDAATKAIASVEQRLALWGAAQNLWYGLSLGSVLLLAAIGLAVTFGVMGVINMAHGEMVMIGAYATFLVQEAFRQWAPGLFDFSILVALPVAFLVSGAVGVAIERSVIRWLYGRPLETLLATWGLSLALQQAVRSIFGPTNREVGAPSWMSGAFELGGLTITYGRLWIVVFAFLVFGALLVALRKTWFGLSIRAVTQNRSMANAMGIRTARVDALTFGLGSGIAGLAGVALSQIDNVSPNLGQGYIIDSFMVVVFGGVGNLWGTLVGALALGGVNKFLEPYAGAVLGKILVLIFIILFIQRRPRGLFALKGRAVEA
ncbi:urea ABC transporter permease [Azospirillum argentinense]|uniref:Urea ABC transporter permease n=1 Tax=Azospirillum argentinense TaxID=2970906 RepID=A0A060DK54_9PROT|nr:urea ABC transporter permease subunit UrtB [Azospirillum argentinense]AIB11084.1 urea ABC transporter permease [Azospirillum argentinense]EZQ08036.1 urea ABC transporter permease [Azospirillum argentinense]